MAGKQLNITLIQTDIVWEDKEANLEHYEALIAGIQDKKEVIVLPEMFSTGFSMAPERLADPMDGRSVSWMRETSARHRCIITGSLMIEEEGKYYNRMIWMQPDGKYGCYDKRHLFAFADEDKHYTRGNTRLVTQVNGFKVCLMVCYDLRFPVWARNSGEDYDVLIYVANWPEKRDLAWRTLLQARAIENMSYVVGVNRIGSDGRNNYAGNSSVFGPLGETIWQKPTDPAVHTVTVDKSTVEDVRKQFPFLNDADKFLLLD